MTRIYSSAAKVLIYLGEETEWSRSAVECIDSVRNQIEIDDTLYRPGPSLSRRNHPEYHFDREIWTRLSRLYDYPWFTRVWVIQESLLADNLEFAVGTRAFPGWLLFSGISYVLSHLDEHLRADLSSLTAPWESILPEKIELIRTWQYFKRGYWTKSFGTLAAAYDAPGAIVYPFDHFDAMTYLKTFECTNPRDRVYGIRAFFDPGITTDYGSTVEEVFREFACYLATSVGLPFHCLNKAGRHKQSLRTLPSWVPDWSAKPVWSFSTQETHNASLGNFAGDLLPCASACKHGRTLRVKGSRIDTVIDMTEPMDSGKPKAYWEPEELGSLEWKHILYWHRRARAFVAKTGSSRYPGTTDRLKVLIRLTALDAFRMDTRNADATDLIGDGVNVYIAALDQLRSRAASDPLVMTEVAGDNRVLAMIKYLAMIPQKHRLCATSKGFFGLVPMEVYIGDRVCIVPGIGCPLILRPEAEDHYSFMGAAFIIDIMNGEALRFSDFNNPGLLLR